MSVGQVALAPVAAERVIATEVAKVRAILRMRVCMVCSSVLGRGAVTSTSHNRPAALERASRTAVGMLVFGWVVLALVSTAGVAWSRECFAVGVVTNLRSQKLMGTYLSVVAMGALRTL